MICVNKNLVDRLIFVLYTANFVDRLNSSIKNSKFVDRLISAAEITNFVDRLNLSVQGINFVDRLSLSLRIPHCQTVKRFRCRSALRFNLLPGSARPASYRKRGESPARNPTPRAALLPALRGMPGWSSWRWQIRCCPTSLLQCI